MANSTRYYQLTPNILLEYVYVDTESDLTGDSTNRIIDLKNKNNLYMMNDEFNGKRYLFCRDDVNDNKSGISYDNLVVGTNQNDSKMVRVLNKETGYKYDSKTSQLSTEVIDFGNDEDACDVFFDTCIIHFTGSNYFGDYDSLIFQASINDWDGSKINLASINFTRTDDIEYNEKPLLINQKLYTTHISFRIPSTYFMLNRSGKKFVRKISKGKWVDRVFTPSDKLQSNTPVQFDIFGVKATYSTGGFNFFNTERLNSIQIPFYDSYKKVNIEIEEATDGDYFNIYAKVNNGMSFSDYMYSLGATPTEYIIMHEINLWENYVDIYNNEKSVKTHSEYYLVNLSANEDDNEIDDIIKYRPICMHANRDVNFIIEDTLRIINTEDNTTIVKKTSKIFGNANKYGKKIGKIFNDEAPLQVNVYNKRVDEDLDYVKISKGAGAGGASSGAGAIESHQHNVSSLVECTNIGVSIQQISRSDIEG